MKAIEIRFHSRGEGLPQCHGALSGPRGDQAGVVCVAKAASELSGADPKRSPDGAQPQSAPKEVAAPLWARFSVHKLCLLHGP